MTDYKLPDNRIRNGYLDDEQNAYKFYDEKKERAKELIDGILRLTSGAFKTDDADYGAKNLVEILEMFMIRHKNFSRSDFAEDLQSIIYDETMAKSDSYYDWRKELFDGQGLDDDGEPLPEKQETEKEVPNILDLSAHATAEGDCIDLAKHIAAVLKDERTPEQIRSSLKDGLSDICLPSQFMESPEFIAKMLCGEAIQNKEANNE